jgi:hypothetical protein
MSQPASSTKSNNQVTWVAILMIIVGLIHLLITYRLIYIGIFLAGHPLDPEDQTAHDTISLLYSFAIQIIAISYWLALVGFLAAGTFGAVMSVLQLVTAFGLFKLRFYKLAVIVSIITWFMIPFGTPLGIGSFIILKRPSVRSLFPTKSPPGS